MIEYENECVSCGFPCLGTACPYHSVPHYKCDECREETDIYHFDSEELCLSCIANRLVKVGD